MRALGRPSSSHQTLLIQLFAHLEGVALNASAGVSWAPCVVVGPPGPRGVCGAFLAAPFLQRRGCAGLGSGCFLGFASGFGPASRISGFRSDMFDRVFTLW
eukprot:5055644-Pyramimonas_sp.AAC.1